MLFSQLKYYLKLYITDTALKVSRSLYFDCGVQVSLMLFSEISTKDINLTNLWDKNLQFLHIWGVFPIFQVFLPILCVNNQNGET